ncbi:O-antigen ligase family protein [Emticicia sp.]|uniref:O-antigen ligase family protein n=1 Tax=Emticicia sp. TaxID=1930953 RepID=UPI0037520A8E
MDKKYWIFLIIITLGFGNLGGSFQPSRLLLIISIVFLRIKIRNNVRLSSTIGLIVCAIWFIYSLITLIWSTSPLIGLNSEIIANSIGMLSLLVFSNFPNEKYLISTIRNGWICGLGITILMGVYEVYTGNHFWYAEDDRILGGIGIEVPYATGFFGNSNNYCTFIILCFPYALWLFFETHKIVFKLILLALILTCTFLIFIDGSRMATIVLLFQSIYFLISFAKNIFKNIIIVLIIAVALFIYVPWDALFLVLNYRGANFEEDSRSVMVLAGLKMLVMSYGFGVGAGSFEDYAINMNNFDHISNPHNLFLEIVSQYGWIIFTLFNFWLFHIFIKSIKNTTISKGAKVTVQILILTIPLIGAINSIALGTTCWWVCFSSLAVIVDSRQIQET